MREQQLYRELEGILYLDTGVVIGDETLDEIGWDSLAAVAFLAVVDGTYGLSVSAQDLHRVKTVGDLRALVCREAVDQ
jgi:acyl carrier protein